MLTLSAAALTAAVAAPADAVGSNFPDYGTVDHQSGSSTSPKPDSVHCTNGRYVVGAGVTAAGSADLRYDELIPSEHDVDAYASVDDSGVDTDWSLRTRAVCSDQPGIGYEIVSATSTPRDSDPSHEATASCSGGKVLLGTGWAIDSGDGHVGVTEVRPTANHTVEVTAYEDDTGWAGSWDVTAYAVCAAGISGQRIQSYYTGYHSSTHGATNGCDVGEVSLGGGFQVQGEQAYTALSFLWPGGFYDNQWLLSVTVKEDDAGTPDSWGMTHYQICADA
jgi:hypothetical protein